MIFKHNDQAYLFHQLLHGGSSDQEKAAEKQYNQIGAYNPTARNRYDKMNLFRYPDMAKSLDKYTTKAGDKIKGDTATNVNEAGKATAASGQSRGFGGSILQDMITKARTQQAAGGTNALKDLMLKRLSMEPGLMQMDNSNQFAQTGGAQGVDMQNIINMFTKFGAQGNAMAGLDNDTWFDDALAIGNTVGGFIG